MYRYNQRERRTVLEFMDDFKSVRMPLHWLLQAGPYTSSLVSLTLS